MVREWFNLLRGVKRLLGWRCRSPLRWQLANQETCDIATPTQSTTHSDGNPGIATWQNETSSLLPYPGDAQTRVLTLPITGCKVILYDIRDW